MSVPAVTTSAAGSLNLLEDDDRDVRSYALAHLLAIVPQFWAEISEKLPYIELLADPLSNELPADQRPLAALLISKTYFFVGELDEAVEFALKAKGAFEKEPEGEFRETIIAGCLDRAIRQTQAGEQIDPALASIVDGVLRSSSGENGKLAMGLALSLRRLDLIEMIFLSSRSSSAPGPSKAGSRPQHDESLLRYVLNEVVSGASGNEAMSPEFRSQLFSLLLRLFTLNASPDYNSITAAWIQHDDSASCGEALAKLVEEEKLLEAYQIGFDLAEGAGQGFIEGVKSKLVEKGLKPDEAAEKDDPKRVLDEIIGGVKSAELFLNFLNKNNKTDMSILKVTKESLEDRYSIYHSAITFTNAFCHAGTTSDRFLRENLDWLGRASNWAKFSATAALGVIHRGSWVNGIRVVKPYLPGGSAPSKYSEGGALFALGLIYAGRKEGGEEALKGGLEEGMDPVVQHGAALGMGVSAMGTGDEEIYELIRTALYQDHATSGEAAGYAMGLVMLGTGSEKAVEEMLSYARETQHEKIVRSLAVGVGLVMYGRREGADTVIEGLCEEKDAIMRYGGMYALALAYAGTGSNKAVRKLLHVAVSDVNDDVRRAAVTALGFVLFRNHQQVPRVVQLLSESYNPHVRYGATLALGISCAGTGLEAAVDLLEPMTRDPVDFVRQGAFLSLSMILIQQPDTAHKAVSTRELLSKVTSDKHEDPMARFGASLAQGIIDAGGRNMTLALSTRAGTLNTPAIIGMAMFTQFWYWFPLAHFLGLAFSPTAIIALDEKLRVPDISFKCNAKASGFAYPSGAKKVEKKGREKTEKAVLSTTARAQVRERRKKKEEGVEGDVDMDEKAAETPKADSSTLPAAGGSTPPASSTTPAAKKTPVKPAEPSTFTLKNMTRVLPSQVQYLAFDPPLASNGRYEPIRPIGSTTPPPTSEAPKENGTRRSGTPVPGAVRELGKPSGRATEGRSGSIILLRDSRPTKGKGEGEGEGGAGGYIELDKALWPDHVPAAEAEPEAPAAQPPAVQQQQQQQEEFEEAAPPPSFEYPFDE